LRKKRTGKGILGKRRKGKGEKEMDGKLRPIVGLIFAALHGMQTRSSDENAVCPSVCLSVKRVLYGKMEERSFQNFIHERSFSLVF